MTTRETARAKINLTLRVIGRRADGYHELESLVAFAAIGDSLSLDPGKPKGVTITGEFGGSIAGANLVAVALDALSRAGPDLTLGHITLDKTLPIAAGIGGGSADAAAVLRLVRAENASQSDAVDWTTLAKSLGADVPVCFANTACWMDGIGERLTPLAVPFPELAAVLVNPCVSVPADKTARVFRALGAAPLANNPTPDDAKPALRTHDDVLRLMRATANDLEPAARAIVPEIGVVLAALSENPSAEIVRMSGGGPTCFAIYRTDDDAREAAAQIRTAQPQWWVAPTTLS